MQTLSHSRKDCRRATFLLLEKRGRYNISFKSIESFVIKFISVKDDSNSRLLTDNPLMWALQPSVKMLVFG